MKYSRLLTFVFVAAACVQVSAAQPVAPVITNLVAVQRPGRFYVDITYDLIDPDSPWGVEMQVQASVDGGTNYNLVMRTLTGDVGLVTPGLGKKAVWNAWDSWPTNYTPIAKVRLLADDWTSTLIATNAANYTTNVPPTSNVVWVPSGGFNMSGVLVYISRSFWMGKYEVTQAEYQELMTNNPSRFSGHPNHPVEQVTWYDAVQYCQTLTAREQAAGRIGTNWVYRLPTEAEWEYACRAGTTSAYYFGEYPVDTHLRYIAWYDADSGSQTHDVGQKAPNRWGLYDMAGNVREWCQDRYDWWWIYNHQGESVTDPLVSNGSDLNLRGGGWGDAASSCTSAYREDYRVPSSSSAAIGFRVVLAPAGWPTTF